MQNSSAGGQWVFRSIHTNRLNQEVNIMEYLILAAALSIMGIGLIASIIGLVEFTRSFGDSPQDPPLGAVGTKPGS